ncbi:hypothetical protein [Paraburkholderia sp. WP4_3_2]|uniref:hypothetical protein n=1 Tax=Paraburkholderia sp. WP4_3_2 TaxID=2587162 RepID=UPI00161AAADB|nr:hypothetical protein [Paraburkholderia sp. WP4_3_2]MBB3262331.1 uncharacterized protein YciI [Paraburkholderia sp. WP4_3_2]
MYIATISPNIPSSTLPAGVDELRALWLDGYLAVGEFLAAGPVSGRDSQVVIAGALPRTRLDAILASDPWVMRGLGTYTTTEIATARLADGLQLPRSNSFLA